jgi:DnaJ-class molecular chaperone
VRTLYMVLRVPPAIPADQLRAAYMALAKQHHPDKGGDSIVFGEINAAWAVLKDKTLREQYDRQLALRGHHCSRCRGEGYEYRTVSFTQRRAIECEKCKGTGQDDYERYL